MPIGILTIEFTERFLATKVAGQTALVDFFRFYVAVVADRERFTAALAYNSSPFSDDARRPPFISRRTTIAYVARATRYRHHLLVTYGCSDRVLVVSEGNVCNYCCYCYWYCYCYCYYYYYYYYYYCYYYIMIIINILTLL